VFPDVGVLLIQSCEQLFPHDLSRHPG